VALDDHPLSRYLVGSIHRISHESLYFDGEGTIKIPCSSDAATLSLAEKVTLSGMKANRGTGNAKIG
jgi:hypothetical protein